MEINAKIDQSLRFMRIITRNQGGMNYSLSTDDARKFWERGVVDKCNAPFRALVANDFDVKATLAHYQRERERLAAEKAQSD